mmetsp:Transcript_102374/g.180430  ORF Transcript_102374/g.180430 Transcript_102374/m.180430 type:complete len:877 (-) Transcript_102374:70-2700(-)
MPPSRAVPCNLCGQMFFPASLKFHMKTCQERQQKMIMECPYCGVETTVSNLEAHVRKCKGAAEAAAKSAGGKAGIAEDDRSSSDGGGGGALSAFLPDGRVRCQFCSRGFSADRIHKHVSICGKLKNGAKVRKEEDPPQEQVKVDIPVPQARADAGWQASSRERTGSPGHARNGTARSQSARRRSPVRDSQRQGSVVTRPLQEANRELQSHAKAWTISSVPDDEANSGDWRTKHREVIDAIRSARNLKARKNSESDVSGALTPPPMEATNGRTSEPAPREAVTPTPSKPSRTARSSSARPMRASSTSLTPRIDLQEEACKQVAASFPKRMDAKRILQESGAASPSNSRPPRPRRTGSCSVMEDLPDSTPADSPSARSQSRRRSKPHADTNGTVEESPSARSQSRRQARGSQSPVTRRSSMPGFGTPGAGTQGVALKTNIVEPSVGIPVANGVERARSVADLPSPGRRGQSLLSPPGAAAAQRLRFDPHFRGDDENSPETQKGAARKSGSNSPYKQRPPPRMPGSFVRVNGLSNASHLNGQLAVLMDFDVDADCWLARLDGGEVKALRSENIVMASPRDMRPQDMRQIPDSPRSATNVVIASGASTVDVPSKSSSGFGTPTAAIRLSSVSTGPALLADVTRIWRATSDAHNPAKVPKDLPTSLQSSGSVSAPAPHSAAVAAAVSRCVAEKGAQAWVSNSAMNSSSGDITSSPLQPRTVQTSRECRGSVSHLKTPPTTMRRRSASPGRGASLTARAAMTPLPARPNGPSASAMQRQPVSVVAASVPVPRMTLPARGTAPMPSESRSYEVSVPDRPTSGAATPMKPGSIPIGPPQTERQASQVTPLKTVGVQPGPQLRWVGPPQVGAACPPPLTPQMRHA